VADLSRCSQCGSAPVGALLGGLCPSCLLGLGLADGDEVEPDDDPLLPGAVYRVLTVLSSEHDRTSYLADQGHTRRLVTLDVVRVPAAGGDESLARCRERLRALMRWAHPGVPKVIDGRRSPSGDYCVVAHYASGPRLDRFCDAHGLEAGSRADLFSRVCETVSEGHQLGICHGRLRPDLVIVAGPREHVQPLILGYSVIPDRAPAIADDLSGLETVARAMGWQGPEGCRWPSVDALREAASRDWLRVPARQNL